jgi:uncharacterized protein (DUF488 family)
MCAERLPRACHRSLLSDYLILGGASVQHLIEADRAVDHLLHENARRESVELVYDRLCQQTLL